jgi:hypothetical protein
MTEPTAADIRAAFAEWELTLTDDGWWTARLVTSDDRPQPRVTARTLARLAEALNDLIGGTS